MGVLLSHLISLLIMERLRRMVNIPTFLKGFSLENSQGIAPKQANKAKVSIPKKLAICLKKRVSPNKSFPKKKIENGIMYVSSRDLCLLRNDLRVFRVVVIESISMKF